MSLGVIISTHSLVLQKVTRSQGGDYTCLAANPRGETMSQPVNLRVRCKYSSYFIFNFKYTPTTSSTQKKKDKVEYEMLTVVPFEQIIKIF